jgi:hypothetical protein
MLDNGHEAGIHRIDLPLLRTTCLRNVGFGLKDVLGEEAELASQEDNISDSA